MRLIKWAKIAAAVALGITLWTGPSEAAGTTPLAMAIQRDSQGNDAPGCLLYFYIAGTVASPQNAYADFGLTQPLSNPLQCDQAGRVPMHWLADGLIHLRLTTSTGTPIVDTTMQVLGPSSGGGGGGGTVDPTTILATGDEKTRYGTGPITGFVRENGLTLGNATSGATERANADTQALFVYLYNTDPNLAVSGGRTGNALNDYNASKQLTLPDMRGRINGYLADMGNSATTVLTAASCASPTVLGFSCGNQTKTLGLSELPTGITSNGANSISVSSGNSGGTSSSIPYGGSLTQPVQTVGAGLAWGIGAPPTIGAIVSTNPTQAIAVTSNNTGGLAHAILPPIMLKTIYLKL